MIHSLSSPPTCDFRNRAKFSKFIIPHIIISFSLFQTQFMSEHFFTAKITEFCRSLKLIQNHQTSRSFYKASENAQMRHYYSTFVSNKLVFCIYPASYCLILAAIKHYIMSWIVKNDLPPTCDFQISLMINCESTWPVAFFKTV